jgi:alanyl-tRNA synthetase
MGGQVADHGAIGGRFTVHDVQKNKGGKYMHYGKLEKGELKVGDTVPAAIDMDRRKAVQRAHSATHLLHRALRTVLGDHVQQAGSLVEPDRLRFDFTHFSAMTAQELAEVSRLVNAAILEGYSVRTEEMGIDAAKQAGAVALFGEKYGDVVRVVSMGDYSVELCGGTHLDNTAKTGVFHIESEGSVASGVRRIEATTGLVSLETMHRAQQLLFQTAGVFKVKPAELRERAEQSVSELKDLRHRLEHFKAKEAAGEADRYLFAARAVGGLKVVTAAVGADGANHLRAMGDRLRDKASDLVGVLATVAEDKVTFLAVCGKEAVAKGVRAGDIIKAVTAIAGGSGGGKPDSAMGGGKDPSKLDEALAAVDGLVRSRLGL